MRDKVFKFVEKQLPYEAVQWTGENVGEIVKFVEGDIADKKDYDRVRIVYYGGHANIKVNAAYGIEEAVYGDYICKLGPDLFRIESKETFENRYEAIKE